MRSAVTHKVDTECAVLPAWISRPLPAAFPGSPLVLSQFLRRAVRLLAKIGALRQHFLLASPVGAVVSAAFAGSSPGIPCRRSFGFQGAVLDLAIKNRHTTT